MSFQTLMERLAALQESNNQLQELIDRLQCMNFQPGTIPLDNEGVNVISELGTEIQQTIKDQGEDFELLQEETSALDSGRLGSELEEQKAGLEEVIKRAVADLQKLQRDYRKAQITARRNYAAAQRVEREILLQSYADPHLHSSSPDPTQRRTAARARKDLSKDEMIINASSDVTLALRRTHNMMTAELSRSQFARDTLKESTAALERLGETYSRLDTMLSSSKHLLSNLISSQKSDTWYLETAFMVLSITLGWLIFRRLIYGPAWWLVWLPLKMIYKSSVGIVSTMGLLSGANTNASLGDMNVPTPQMHDTWSSVASAAGSQASAIKDIGGQEIPGTLETTASAYSLGEEVGEVILDERDKSEQPLPTNGEPPAFDSQQDPVKDYKETDERQELPQRNPKKRIWEEEVVEKDGRKDEL